MTADELRDALAEIAREAGLDVRVSTRGSEAEPLLPLHSGVCRVRGEVWVILAAGDTIEDHVQVLADAVRNHAGELLESRFLPPAVRERLDR